jgi:hypothetical protein
MTSAGDLSVVKSTTNAPPRSPFSVPQKFFPVCDGHKGRQARLKTFKGRVDERRPTLETSWRAAARRLRRRMETRQSICAFIGWALLAHGASARVKIRPLCLSSDAPRTVSIVFFACILLGLCLCKVTMLFFSTPQERMPRGVGVVDRTRTTSGNWPHRRH